MKKNDKGDVMSQQEMITVQCTGCGHTLQIPEGLDEFSCLYCGARMTKQNLPAPVPPSEAEAALSYYKDHILDVIRNHLGIEKMVTGKDFDGAFTGYMNANRAVFEQLDLAVRGGVCNVDTASSVFLDQLEQYWENGTDRKQSKKFMLETDKFVIAVFLVPMIGELNLSISKSYSEALQKLWCQRHPKAPFYIGTYSDLSKGFQKKILGLCFITTALCRQEGKPDDCAELTAFRAFRDGYLRSCPDGQALIEEYYDIAPGIVLHLDQSCDKDVLYADLKKTYLQPCYEDILAGRFAACKERYVAMVRSLERKYLH